jgi:multidrug efflux pump subunit AcrB
MPPGITPPLIIKYSASSIPVIQLGLSSPRCPSSSCSTRGQLPASAADHHSRCSVPYPYGGKNRLISVDLDTAALLARGLTPSTW